MRKFLSILLCVLLLLSCTILPVFAEEKVLTISTKEDFLTFAVNCRLDSYSKGLSVQLTADIDLTDTEFRGIPVFFGTFIGNGHQLTGVSITPEGSHVGFFRYVEEGAVISDLHIRGTVAPGGTGSAVGGIAGVNAGTIRECSFSGTVTGTDNVGGIAGKNALTGIIEGCATESQTTVSGSHFVGGIAGENSGVVRTCANSGSINTTEKQNKVDISDITIDTLTGTESTITVTDIGGIAGSSSGVIRSCENKGNVGYPHIGYNIGGIAGRQAGFLTECVNYGTVHGRKDVGGIVGQLEPSTTLIFREDTIQVLSGQLEELSRLTDKAADHADSSGEKLSTQIAQLDTQVQSAKDATDKLIPDANTLPDPDSVIAAGAELSSTLTQIGATLGAITSETETGAQTLTADIIAISKQMDAIEKTLQSGEDGIHSDIADISGQDTDADTTAKISLSTNAGPVSGDWSTGGIAGCIGFENDLDPELDISISGSASLNQTCDIRAVVRSCINTSAVTGKNRNTGGVVGLMTLGLVQDCTDTAPVSAAAGDYTGGIVGQANGGFIRSCFVKATVTGGYCTGGVAGTAPVLIDCRVMARLAGTEATGAIVGKAEDRSQVSGNFYLPVGTDIGGIDGISFDGCAQPQTLDSFLALDALPDLFKTNNVTFRFPDGSQQTLTVAQGSSPDSTSIPSIPAQDGTVSTWIGLDGAVLDNILFDSVFEVSNVILPTTLASDVLRKNGQPVLLVQGTFPIGSILTAQQIDADPRMEACMEAWNIDLPEGSQQLRYQLPEGCDPSNVLLRLQNADYSWRDVPFTVDGNYIIAAVQNGDRALQLVKAPASYTVLILTGATLLLVGTSFTIAVLLHRKKKKKS